jgi:hypothetical protein
MSAEYTAGPRLVGEKIVEDKPIETPECINRGNESMNEPISFLLASLSYAAMGGNISLLSSGKFIER